MQAPSVVVLEGDAREWFAACSLTARGFDVAFIGPRPARGAAYPGSPAFRRSLAEAISFSQVVVGPVRGLAPEQATQLVDLLRDTRAAAPRLVVVGRPATSVREACERAGVPVVDILLRDDFAIANAVPTAEGAIVEALLASDVTLAGSQALVLGFGRTGRVLAHRLHALGCRVVVCARSAPAREEARALGIEAVAFDGLDERLPRADFVFNTVPALVLTAARLRRCRTGTVVVDIASPPGGTDFEAATAMGLTVRWPLGIPGRFAPRTAGRIVADVVCAVLAEHGFPVPPTAGGAADRRGESA